MQDVDRLRYDPARLAEFERHREDWKAGKIRLENYCQGYLTETDGKDRARWYGGQLGGKVLVDKANFFEAVGYRPSYPACMFHASLARFRVFSGGARAGKSMAAGLDVCPVLLTPGTHTWLVAPEYSQAEKELLYIAANTVEHPVISKEFHLGAAASTARGGRWVCRPKDGDMEIRLAWGHGLPDSWVRVKSSEKPNSLLSEELDLLVVCEASLIPPDRWKNKLLMRLTTRSGCAVLPATPAGGTGWFADLFREGLSGRKPELYHTVTCDSRFNPTLAPEEIEVMQEQMTDEDFLEQVVGRPTPRFGLVLPGFDRSTHTTSWRREWPRPEWIRHRGFDFGYRDPYVVLWIARDEERRWYVYRELYKTRQLTKDVIRHIAQVEGLLVKVDSGGNSILHGSPTKDSVRGMSVVDWDASARAELQRAGIRCKRANKEIDAGIRTLAQLLRPAEDGRPRLYVSHECTNLLNELASYSYDTKSELPKDQDNHAIDALRYVVHTIEPASREIQITSA